MDCRMTQGELVAFTFGTASEEARDRVDLHLLTCTACLRAYLRFKHHVERGASSGARPSDDVKARIRDDVAALVRPRGAARVVRSLRRPIPLYQGLAVACLAAGIAMASPWIREEVAGSRAVFAPSPVAPSPAAESRVDTSRAIAESNTIY